MKNLILLALMGISFPATAKLQCLDFFSRHPLEAPQERIVDFRNVSVYRRNNNIGVQQQGHLRVHRWIQLAPYTGPTESFVGLTDDGRLFHIVQWPGRKVARLLSGTHTFQNFFVYQDQTLIAVDSDNRLYFYSNRHWQHSPRGALFRRAAALWGGTTAAAITLIGVTAPEALTWSLHIGEWASIPLMPAFVATLSAMTTLFTSLQSYDLSNSYPAAFKSSPLAFTNERDLFTYLDSHPEVIEFFNNLQNWESMDPTAVPPLLPATATNPIQ